MSSPTPTASNVLGSGAQMTKNVVCIVGMAQSRNDWMLDGHFIGSEVWCLNQGNFAFHPDSLSHFTRWFQIHPYYGMVNRYRNPEYLEWLRTTTIPVYLNYLVPDLVPSGIVYPFEEVVDDLGSNYFAINTIGYMIALAILEKFSEIRVYGINMGDYDLGDRYARPAIEFLLGVAVGRGIKVWVSPESALLNGNLYAQPLNIPTPDVYSLMNGLRSLVERMPFGPERQAVNQMVLMVEQTHLEAVQGKARVVVAE